MIAQFWGRLGIPHFLRLPAGPTFAGLSNEAERRQEKCFFGDTCHRQLRLGLFTAILGEGMGFERLSNVFSDGLLKFVSWQEDF
jgi:hypothetical protein